MIKSLGSSTSLEQKVAQLAKNYIELERESNKQTSSLRQSEKVLEKELREKEHLQREYNKGVLIRYALHVYLNIENLNDLENMCFFLATETNWSKYAVNSRSS